jgi:hypothetical protein
VQACEQRKRSLAEGSARLDHVQALASVDLAMIAPQLRARLDDWRSLLTRHVGVARQILKKLIPERLVFTPHVEGDARSYTFAGMGRLDQLLQGLVALPTVGSGRVTAERDTVVRQGWWPQRDSNPCFRPVTFSPTISRSFTPGALAGSGSDQTRSPLACSPAERTKTAKAIPFPRPCRGTLLRQHAPRPRIHHA